MHRSNRNVRIRDRKKGGELCKMWGNDLIIPSQYLLRYKLILKH
jgi:hypothetical protein